MKNKNFLNTWNKSNKIIKNKLNKILKSLSDYYIKDDAQFKYNTTGCTVGYPLVSAIIKFEKREWIKGKARKNYYGLDINFELLLTHFLDDDANEENTYYKLIINFGDDCVYPKIQYTTSGYWEDLKEFDKFIEEHRKKVIKMVTK